MLFVIITVICGGSVASLAHPRVRRSVGRATVRFGYAYARVRFPAMFIDWEDVRYQRWLQDRANPESAE